MIYLYILCAMLFAHIVDDYYLQGILASMKQKEWWQKQSSYKDLYKNDYKIALILHSFSWSFVVMLPLIIFGKLVPLAFPFLVSNTIIHAFVDNEKANKKSLSLVQDQLAHFIQIFTTWLIYSAYLIGIGGI